MVMGLCCFGCCCKRGIKNKIILSDGAHQALLGVETDTLIVKKSIKQSKKQEEYEALQSFLNSIRPVAFESSYVRGESNSNAKGVFTQCFVTFAILLLAVGAGQPIGFSAVALPQLRVENSTLRIDDEMGSWIASIHSAATPFGATLSGPFMDRLGRRRTLQMTAPLLVVGWIIIGTSMHHAVFLLGRFVCGFAVGMMLAPSQVYIGEFSEPKLRGLLIGSPFVAYALGILYVYALGGSLPWRSVAYLSTLIPVLAFIALSLSPESPTWLARRGFFHDAMASMLRFRGDRDTAQRELYELISEQEKEKARGGEKVTFLAVVHASVLKPLFLINAFNILQVLSGTYVVIFYAVDIIRDAGGALEPTLAANCTALTRFIATAFVCVVFLKATRRPVVLISGAGSSICSIALAFIISQGPNSGVAVPIFIMGYITFNTIGFFVLPGLMVGELLPTKVRGICGGYIFGFFNAVLFGFTKLYPVMSNSIGAAGMFGIFGAAATVATIMLFLILPETKGRSLLEIEQYYKNPNILWITRKKHDGVTQRI